MGLGPLVPFIVAWAVMMAAMMFPSAMPLMFEFARNAERRRGWRVATSLLGMTYLGVWLAFGVVCYVSTTRLACLGRTRQSLAVSR